MILADKIIILRKDNGWSQEELAEQLGVSRQSVSKWELGASVPDLDKILGMSSLFEVSTDYLLKDELEEPEYAAEPKNVPEDSINVSVELANEFLEVRKTYSERLARGIILCILVPILTCFVSELIWELRLTSSASSVLELLWEHSGELETAAAIAEIVLGTVLIVSGVSELSRYSYLGKTKLTLQYGVRGIVEKRQEEYGNTYRLKVITGTALVVSELFAIVLFFSAISVGRILVWIIAALAVYQLLTACMMQNSFKMLLHEDIPAKDNEKKNIDLYLKIR